MEAWRAALKADPLPWLLEREDPAVRHLALVRLCDEPKDAGEVRRARRAAMRADPIAGTLAAQDPEGSGTSRAPGTVGSTRARCGR